MLTCFVTFDQPLYIKARDIIACTPLSDKSFIVPRLGGFHMLMSYFGCIGYIMGGSGIKEALSTIYAEKTVDMIFTGHVYAIAVRAHSHLQLALIKLIFKEFETTNSEFHYLMNEDLDLPTTLCNLSSEDVDIDNITHSVKIQQLISIVEKKCKKYLVAVKQENYG